MAGVFPFYSAFFVFRMDQATHNKIVSFIWGIADDVLRDLFKRGKYPDVILPMCVLRRMDAVLEQTKKQVLETKEMLDKGSVKGEEVTDDEPVPPATDAGASDAGASDAAPTDGG